MEGYYKLSESLLKELHDKGIFFLNQISNQDQILIDGVG
jgi:hypothetical protein